MCEIIDNIKKLYVDCPDCESMYSDDQYTCATCWCEGGQGTINVYDWIESNKKNPTKWYEENRSKYVLVEWTRGGTLGIREDMLLKMLTDFNLSK